MLKLTIAELEALLNSEQVQEFNILPNGMLEHIDGHTVEKPLTFKENLGGEYGFDNTR